MKVHHPRVSVSTVCLSSITNQSKGRFLKLDTSQGSKNKPHCFNQNLEKNNDGKYNYSLAEASNATEIVDG